MNGNIKFFLAELKKNPLSTITGVSIIAIVYLVLYIKTMIYQHDQTLEAAKRELIDTERRCSLEIDAIRKEQIQEAKEAAERQTKIEREIRSLIKTKR
jgi:hypothetical protein